MNTVICANCQNIYTGIYCPKCGSVVSMPLKNIKL